MLTSVQRPEREVALCATRLLIIEAVKPHICLLDFCRTVVKRIGDVGLGGNGYFHFGCQHRVIGALDTLWGDFKYSGHNYFINCML